MRTAPERRPAPARRAAPERRAAPGPAGQARPHRRRGRWLRRLATVLVVCVIVAGGSFVALVGFSPSVGDASQRVAAILRANHAPVDQGPVPARLAAALIATENSRFYHDPALDLQGVARATIGFVTQNGNDGGATLEQQLAKMLYVPSTSLPAEFRQVGIAFKLDLAYSKPRILSLYLDAAYFGDGAYGFATAAEHYFGLPPAALSWGQASLLAGLLQAPSAYDPHGHLHLARARQRHVLDRLVATHVLTSARSDAVFASPLDPVVPFFG